MTILDRRAVLLGTAAAAGATRVRAASSPTGEMERLATAFVADGVVPGVGIAFSRGGQIVFARGFGLANIEDQAPVTPATVFRIGSVTKQFTGAAFALLAADGKLSYDDRLSRFLPEVPRAEEVTLRRMLTHTAGFGNYTDRKPPTAFLVSARQDYDAKVLLADMLAHTDPLYIGPPGVQWAYSNTAFVLLGLIIEKVTGAPYADFFAKRLFGPAGLADTAVDDVSVVLPHRAAGYTGHAGAPAGFDNAAFISMTYPGAAGSMRSTASDLCRWHTALLGGRVVPAAGLQAMLTPARLNDGSQPISKGMPDGPKPVDYGFGLFRDSFEGHATVQHDGGIFGFISSLRSFPAEHVSVAVLTNFDARGHATFLPRYTALKDAAARAALAA